MSSDPQDDKTALAKALHEAQQPNYGDAWMQAHKGGLLKVQGYVWHCDDDCGCSEPVIVAVFRNSVSIAPPSVVRIGLWNGEFRTDHETGAYEELAAKRRDLAETEPEIERIIEWAS